VVTKVSTGYPGYRVVTTGNHINQLYRQSIAWLPLLEGGPLCPRFSPSPMGFNRDIGGPLLLKTDTQKHLFLSHPMLNPDPYGSDGYAATEGSD
jgi:hypothetical protein